MSLNMVKVLVALVAGGMSGGVIYGAAPTISNVRVDGISTSSATIRGDITPAPSDGVQENYRIYLWSGNKMNVSEQAAAPVFYYHDASVNYLLYDFPNGSGLTNGHLDSVASLQPDTTYHYRIEAEHGSDITFMTGTFRTVALPPVYELVTDGEPVTINPAGTVSGDYGGTLGSLAPTDVQAGPYDYTITDAGLTLTSNSSFEAHALVQYHFGLGDNTVPYSYAILRASQPVVEVVHATGDTDPRLAEGEVFTGFGKPEMTTYQAFVKKPGGSSGEKSVILSPSSFFRNGPLDPKNLPTPTITDFAAPSGDSTLAIAAGKNQDRALIITALDPAHNPYQDFTAISLAAGSPIQPGSFNLLSIEEIDGNPVPACKAKLGFRNAPEIPPVDGLIMGDTQKLFVGNFINGEQVTKLDFLESYRYSPAQGRWRIGAQQIGAKVTFGNGGEALVSVGSGETPDVIVHTGPSVISTRLNYSVTHFKRPAFSPSGVVALADIRASGRMKGTVLASFALDGTSLELGLENANVAGPGGKYLPDVLFKRFNAPVMGSYGKVAFRAELKGKGVSKENDLGLWYANDGAHPIQLVRKGDPAVGGGVWADFTSLVLPGSPAPVTTEPAAVAYAKSLSAPRFVARLKKGVDGVTAKNDRGIWGVDSAGNLQLMLRTGQTIDLQGTPKVVQTFRALETAAYSTGAAHGYDQDGKVAAVVTFTDGQEALLRLALP